MLLHDFIRFLNNKCTRITIYDDNSSDILFDDTVSSLYNSNNGLLFGKIKRVDIHGVKDRHPVNIGPNNSYRIDTEISVDIDIPNTFNLLMGSLKLFKNKVRRRDIMILMNKIFYRDKYYIPLISDLYDNHPDYKFNVWNKDSERILIYNKSIRDCSLVKQTEPIFRILVYEYNGSIDNIKIPIFHPDNSLGDNVDLTMAFSLEPIPKPLQSYEMVKRRLNGNIISQERITDLVNFVSLNYEEFRKAWDIDTNKINTYVKGFDDDRLIVPVK